ncbi:MAG: HD domain-containing protein [Bacteroidota bacterium]|nr:HD domain-containing protein [Bacteroidota bacterium]
MSKELTLEEKEKYANDQFKDLIESSPRIKKSESLDKVKHAFQFAREAHKNVFRKGGEHHLYITHPIAVAKIVAVEMGFGSTTVIAALLHDVVEDTDISLETIENDFGKEVALIVDGLTKITNVFNPNNTSQAATFQKLILKISEDRRVAFVKIADRLHNLRTMDEMRTNSQMVKTGEALIVYAPLAFQLGLLKIRKEIENLSFRLREPEEYSRVERLVKKNKLALEREYDEIFDKIKNVLKDARYRYDIIPITKSYFHLREKMRKDNLDFDQIVNFQSKRIVFEPTNDKTANDDCFILLGRIFGQLTVQPQSFQDMISRPKLNGFQALILNIFHDGKWVELQIMTDKMDEIANRGYAKNHENKHLNKISDWVNRTEQLIKAEELSNFELIDILTINPTSIHVFTPKGDVYTLTKDSTVLDFAFKIHTEIGLHFLSAEIGKKPAEINQKLKTGDLIKIIHSEKVSPKPEWMNYLSVAGNKAKLKRYFKKERQNFISEGKELLAEVKTMFNIDDEQVSKILNHFNLSNTDELKYRLGKKEILTEDIKAYIKSKSSFSFNFFNPFTKKGESDSKLAVEITNRKVPFRIHSLDNIILSDCCRPIPGDESMLYFAPDNIAVVHKRDCPEAKRLNAIDGNKTRAVKWDLIKDVVLPAKIKLVGKDRQGVLSEIIDVIYGEHEVNMKSLKVDAGHKIFIGTIELLVKDKNTLDNILRKARSLTGVSKANRL